MSLPAFCVDGEHRAVLLVGRGTELGSVSSDKIDRCVAIAREHAEKTGLPLAFVVASAPGEDADYAGAAAGIVLAHAGEDEPCEVPKDVLGKHLPSDVPPAFWSALAAEGVVFEADTEEDPEIPREGMFLVPAGWSIATLRLGRRPSPAEVEAADDVGEEPPTDESERVLGTASEDTDVARSVSANLLERVRASDKPLFLDASYC